MLFGWRSVDSFETHRWNLRNGSPVKLGKPKVMRDAPFQGKLREPGPPLLQSQALGQRRQFVLHVLVSLQISDSSLQLFEGPQQAEMCLELRGVTRGSFGTFPPIGNRTSSRW